MINRETTVSYVYTGKEEIYGEEVMLMGNEGSDRTGEECEGMKYVMSTYFSGQAM